MQIAALHEPGGRHRGDVFTPAERAVLRFTDLLTTRSGNIGQEDLDALDDHLQDAEVIELVLAVATANWTNRVNDGLGTPLPD